MPAARWGCQVLRVETKQDTKAACCALGPLRGLLIAAQMAKRYRHSVSLFVSYCDAYEGGARSAAPELDKQLSVS